MVKRIVVAAFVTAVTAVTAVGVAAPADATQSQGVASAITHAIDWE